MKSLHIVLAVLATLFSITNAAHAGGGGFGGEKFLIEKCYEGGASGPGTFSSPASGAADGDIAAIPAGTVITGVHVIVISALVGTTVVTVGDDDDADGWVDSGDVTEGTPGVYQGSTSGGYADTVGLGKYYASAGKELKLDITTALSGGKYCVVAQGFRL